MELTSILLGVALIAVTCSALFVFVSAARLYVSEDLEGERRGKGAVVTLPELQIRSGERRRNPMQVNFPLEVNGTLIYHERRSGVDRRQPTVH